jgi:hypothetical protein
MVETNWAGLVAAAVLAGNGSRAHAQRSPLFEKLSLVDGRAFYFVGAGGRLSLDGGTIPLMRK